MNIEVKDVTPEMAEQWLKLNVNNRPLSKRVVDKYAREMLGGHWKLNGDAIRFNGKQLLDGQHRLAAIVKAGVTIQSIVIDGLQTDVFSTIDCGKVRGAGDALSLKGEPNARNLAAVLRVIAQYKQGRMMVVGCDYTNADVLDFCGQYPGARFSTARMKTLVHQARNLAPMSVMGACHFLFAEKDKEQADDFMERLCKGDSLTSDDPVFLLRERLLDNSASKSKLSARYIMALVIKAWNARRVGKTLKYLRWREVGPVPEPFPTVE